MTPPVSFVKKFAWWIGVPFIFDALFWLASASFRLVSHLEPWWRFPVAPSGAPDSYVYFFWAGAAVQRLPVGDFLYWLIPIFRVLWGFTGGRWSMPEFMLLTFMVTTPFTVWVLPWAMRQWSDVTVAQARWLALAFLCVWTLGLGFRPGVYSWFAPFLFASLGCLGAFARRMEQRRRMSAAVFGVIGVGLSFLYPWFFAFAVILVAVETMRSVIRVRRGAGIGLFAAASATAVAAGVWLAPILLGPAFAPILDRYERVGVAFSRLPFFSNATLILLGWMALLLLIARQGEGRRRADERAFAAWACLLLLWFQNLFTGLYVFNEHFAIVAAALGVLTLPLMFDERPRLARRQIPALLAIAAWAFVVYYFAQGLRPSGSLTAYAGQLLNWLMLAVGSTALVLTEARALVRRLGFLALALTGLSVYAAFLLQQWPEYPGVLRSLPMIEWLRADGPPSTRYCSDVFTGRLLSAHTGRRFYPSEGAVFARETNQEYLVKLEAVAAVFDARAAGHAGEWEDLINFGRLAACHTFPSEERWLAALHLSPSQIDALTGCRRQVIAANLARVYAVMDHRAPPGRLLRDVCERVVVADPWQAYWHLPKGMRIIARFPGYTVWSTP